MLTRTVTVTVQVDAKINISVLQGPLVARLVEGVENSLRHAVADYGPLAVTVQVIPERVGFDGA